MLLLNVVTIDNRETSAVRNVPPAAKSIINKIETGYWNHVADFGYS